MRRGRRSRRRTPEEVVLSNENLPAGSDRNGDRRENKKPGRPKASTAPGTAAILELQAPGEALGAHRCQGPTVRMSITHTEANPLSPVGRMELAIAHAR